MRGPSARSSAELITSGGVKPVVANPRRAANSDAAAFSAAPGCEGTTTLPDTKSMIPSPLVSLSIQPAAKGSVSARFGWESGWNAIDEESAARQLAAAEKQKRMDFILRKTPLHSNGVNR